MFKLKHIYLSYQTKSARDSSSSRSKKTSNNYNIIITRCCNHDPMPLWESTAGA